MRVVLVPTGRTEWFGLPAALRRLYPGHEFCTAPAEDEVRSHPDGFPLAGFTSSRMGDPQLQAPPEAARDLIERAARAALGDRRTDPADLVLILEDVELANRDNEPAIVDVVRAAVRQHLRELPRAIGERTAVALRERVSFHLVRPMIEAWFFAEAAALEQAGVPAPAAPHVLASDPERFAVEDPAYLSADDSACPAWVAAGRKKKLRPKWAGTQDRALHPKGYLQWLTRNPDVRGCTDYSETQHGAAALAHLDWAQVMRRPSGQLAYLRALLGDLSDALGPSPWIGPISGEQAALTSRHELPEDHVLRNL